MSSNIIHILLSKLKVRHTYMFTDVLYKTMPHSNTLFGIYNILLEYQIESSPLKLSEKEQIKELDVPFIAHTSSGFCVLYAIKDNIVSCFYDNGQEKQEKLSDFIELCSGIVLIPTVTNQSIEPNYYTNKLQNLFQKIIYCIFGSAAIFICLYFLIANFKSNTIICLILLLNILGFFVSWILLSKENNTNRKLADLACSLFKNSECNKAPYDKNKLFRIFSLAEIGISYFAFNVFVLSLFYQHANIVFFLNLLALPFIVVAIAYQKLVLKSWCSLCLIVHALICSTFVISMFDSSLIQNFSLNNINNFLGGLILFSLFIFLANVYSSQKKLNALYLRNQLKTNTLYWDKDVFLSYLKLYSSQHYSVTTKLRICPTNKIDHIITIFSNPNCNPCAKTEKVLSKIIALNTCKVQYIFVPLSTSHIHSVKILISAILNSDNAHDVIMDWYDNGRYTIDIFIKKYNVNIQSNDVEVEFNYHFNIAKELKISHTPQILYNGHIVPDIFSIEDVYQIC